MVNSGDFIEFATVIETPAHRKAVGRERQFLSRAAAVFAGAR
jgi:hypothetical protein